MIDYAAARRNMVESQIRTNKVSDPAIVDAFHAIPREMFVPKALQGIAYVDEDLHIGGGRYLMEPMVLARLLQTAAPTADDVVLDVGCATGYSTAVLARLTSMVVGLESDQALAKRANESLGRLDIDNAVVVGGALSEGYAKQAPYSLIVLQGAAAELPEALLGQLRENGRLVAVIKGGPEQPGRAVIVERRGGGSYRRVVFDAATPLLPGFLKEAGFVF